MICGVFGLPRAGKTTFLTWCARRAITGKSLHVGHFNFARMIGDAAPYKRVFTNFPLSGCYELKFEWLGVYDFSNSLILIDEIMLVCDSRDWKNFRADLRDFLALHGHYHCDIVYCSQGYSDTDLRIRNLTERIFYIEKSGSFTRVSPIEKKWDIDKQINEGYTLAPPLSSTFIYRKRYYKFFDSFDAPVMPDNPAEFWDLKPPKEFHLIPFLRNTFQRVTSFLRRPVGHPLEFDGLAVDPVLYVVDELPADIRTIEIPVYTGSFSWERVEGSSLVFCGACGAAEILEDARRFRGCPHCLTELSFPPDLIGEEEKTE